MRLVVSVLLLSSIEFSSSQFTGLNKNQNVGPSANPRFFDFGGMIGQLFPDFNQGHQGGLESNPGGMGFPANSQFYPDDRVQNQIPTTTETHTHFPPLDDASIYPIAGHVNSPNGKPNQGNFGSRPIPFPNQNDYGGSQFLPNPEQNTGGQQPSYPNQGGLGAPQQYPNQGNYGGPQQYPNQGNYGGSQQYPNQGNYGGSQLQNPNQNNFGGYSKLPYPNQSNFGGTQQTPYPNQGNFGGPQQFPSLGNPNQGSYGGSQMPYANQGNFGGTPQYVTPDEGSFGYPQQTAFPNNIGNPNNLRPGDGTLDGLVPPQRPLYTDPNNFMPGQNVNDNTYGRPNSPDQRPPQADGTVAILGHPVKVPPITTARPDQIFFPSSTENPSLKQCVQDCETSSEYNPVCGSDNITYINPGKFVCARNCGVKVFVASQGRCPKDRPYPRS